MVLASMLGWLEGPKCLNHRAGTWAGCWPGAQLGLVTRGLAAPPASWVGFLTAGWLSSKEEPFKHTDAEATILFSPALEPYTISVPLDCFKKETGPAQIQREGKQRVYLLMGESQNIRSHL